VGKLPSLETHQRMVATAALRAEIIRAAESVALARRLNAPEQEKLAVDALCGLVAIYHGRKKITESSPPQHSGDGE
jgi:hypothetical protein